MVPPRLPPHLRPENLSWQPQAASLSLLPNASKQTSASSKNSVSNPSLSFLVYYPPVALLPEPAQREGVLETLAVIVTTTTVITAIGGEGNKAKWGGMVFLGLVVKEEAVWIRLFWRRVGIEGTLGRNMNKGMKRLLLGYSRDEVGLANGICGGWC